MPTLNWIGKDAVVKHHEEAPFRLLEPAPELSLPSPLGKETGERSLPSPLGRETGERSLPSPLGRETGERSLPSPLGRAGLLSSMIFDYYF
jgi:hypothetical protein